MNTKVILAGGSGFLGRGLARFWAARGFEVVVLTRSPRVDRGAIREVGWDGESLGDWCRELEGSVSVINLARLSVNCRYDARNRKRLMDSRLKPTRLLGQALALAQRPPTVWMNASTATIYKHTQGPAWGELGETGGCDAAKDHFSVELATAWERELCESAAPGIRKVALRSAMVLGLAENSVLPNLLRLGRWGFGGSLAGGEQYVSWIHVDDFCRATEWIRTHEQLVGPVNLSAPNPVTNREMMGAIREVCGTRFGLASPRWMLEVGAWVLRTETELIIKSRRVVPQKLVASGFAFEHPYLLPAIQHLLAQGNPP